MSASLPNLAAAWVIANLIAGLLLVVAPRIALAAFWCAVTAFFVVGMVLVIPVTLTDHLLHRRP